VQHGRADASSTAGTMLRLSSAPLVAPGFDSYGSSFGNRAESIVPLSIVVSNVRKAAHRRQLARRVNRFQA